MRITLAGFLCFIALNASAAELATGKYVATTVVGNFSAPFVIVTAVNGETVTGTYWWPYRKKNDSPCGGEHQISGTLVGNVLDVKDTNGPTLEGCGVHLELEVNGPSLKGKLNGTPREFLHE